MDWQMSSFLPHFEGWKWGLLDWNGRINPMAAMIKTCNAFNAVSGGYLEELFYSFQGLEPLMNQSGKSFRDYQWY
jgi:starch synthase